MKLKSFISEAISDIIKGVTDAQVAIGDGIVVPANLSVTIDAVKTGITEFQLIDFEVTVNAEEGSGREAGLNVVAAVFGAGIKNSATKSGGHAATLKFKIPIRLPTQKRIS